MLKEDGKQCFFMLSVIQPLHSKTQLTLEHVSAVPGLQYFNKRAVLKQIKTKTKKETIYACLAFLYKRGKKTRDHIRQENNAQSL